MNVNENNVTSLFRQASFGRHYSFVTFYIHTQTREEFIVTGDIPLVFSVVYRGQAVSTSCNPTQCKQMLIGDILCSYVRYSHKRSSFSPSLTSQ